MEISNTDTLVMAKCSGASQQVWQWKQNSTSVKYAKKEIKLQKHLRNVRTTAGTLSIKHAPKVAQELAVGDY